MKFLFILFLSFSQGAFGLCADSDSIKKAVHLFARVHEKEFDPDTKDECGWTALHYAVKYGNEKTVTLLLEKGADPNIETDSGRTALEMLLNRRNEEFFIDYIAGPPMLGMSLERFNLQRYDSMLISLLENGADPDTKNDFGWTALHYAVKYGNEKTVALLLEKGADPNIETDSGRTALEIMLQEKHKDWLAYYVAGNPYIETDINQATLLAYERILTPLQEKGADPNTETDSGRTALEIMLQEKQDVLVHYIGRQPIIATDTNRFTLLAYERILIPLLENGADPNTKNKIGKPLLHIAVEEDVIFMQNQDRTRDLIAVLLEKGADPNMQDSSGWTALHYVAKRKEMIGQMIDSGLEFRLPPGEPEPVMGITRAGLFLELERTEELITLLLEKGADPITNKSSPPEK